ncbi:MAG TPA: MFS transporter [Ktedonobacteraceae bacterium]|nr:MFS transporter [Ktedonobacteraceae bacterium]
MGATTTRTRKRSLFINQNFLLLWIGGTISRLSWILLVIGFGLWIITDLITNPAASTSAVKNIELIALLGLVTIGLFAGVFIDRWKDKKRVLVTTSAARACSSLLPLLAALLLSYAHLPAPWGTGLPLISIYVYMLVVSVLTHFAIPASYSVFVDCVEEQDYSYANGLLLTATFASVPVGFFMAVPLFAAFNIYGILVLCTLMYIVSFIASSQLQVEMHGETSQRKGMFREWGASVAFCFKNPLLLVLLFTLVFINIWNGAFVTLGNTFLSQNLHMAAQQPLYAGVDMLYRDVSITIQVGFAVGSLLAGLVARKWGERRVFSYALLIAGVLMLIVSRFTVYTPALVTIFLLYILLGAVNVIAVPIYLWITPRHFLGRIRSIVDVVSNIVPVVVGGACLVLLGSKAQHVQLQFLGITFTSIDGTLAIAGIVCIAGGILVVNLLTGSRAIAAKKAALSATNEAGSLNSNTAETREPIISGKN